MKRAWIDSINATISIFASLFIFSLVASDCNWGDALLATGSAMGVIVVRALNPKIKDYGITDEKEDNESGT